MELSEEDAIVYEDTPISCIIRQLKDKQKSLSKFRKNSESQILSDLTVEYKMFCDASERWEKAQRHAEKQNNILECRVSAENHRLQTKILRYRILEQHGPEIWRKALLLAKKHEDSPEIDLEEGRVEAQIAKDLLENKLGTWFSPEMEEWEEVINGFIK